MKDGENLRVEDNFPGGVVRWSVGQFKTHDLYKIKIKFLSIYIIYIIYIDKFDKRKNIGAKIKLTN